MDAYTLVPGAQNGTDSKPRAASGKVRKRAAKACLTCRARKVRCDVSLRGAPCMNCHLDNEECVVTVRASRFPRNRRDTGDQENMPAPILPYLPNDAVRSSQVVDERAEPERIGLPPPESSSGRSETAELRRDSTVAPSPQVLTAASTPHPALPIQPPINPPPAYPVVNQAVGIPNYHPNPNVLMNPWPSYQPPLRLTSDVVYTYYPFLCVSNLSNILPQDVNFLDSQDCLRVPTRAVLNEFLQKYFLYVHPLLPLFNEGDFWDMYLSDGQTPAGGRMSLLVLQSLIFATCNFVSRDSIKALGFPSIRAARPALYRRAKLLYDFESESSPISIAQAALLLSYWSSSVSSNGARKPNSNWLNVAIQHAKVADAHHYPSIDTAGSPANLKRQNMLKRIWWCCVIRDRIMSLCVRRSIQIVSAHFDFRGNEPLSPRDLEDEFGRSKVYDAETKRALAEILANVLDLCVVFTDMLVLVYPLDERPGWGKVMTEEDMVRLKSGREALRGWHGKTASSFPVFGGGAKPGEERRKAPQHESVVLYTNLMYMYYHSSRVALCHHEVLHLAVSSGPQSQGRPPSTDKDLPTINSNKQELQDAATGVTECLKELIQRRLARWLPISAMACTALPLVLHILDVKLSSLRAGAGGGITGQAAVKQHRLNILIEAMKTYQPQYEGVDKISDTIRHIVNLAQLEGVPPESTVEGGGAGDQSTSNGEIRDWTDILTSHPSIYLRLALTMDLSFSKDRMPEEGDFPVSLRGLLAVSDANPLGGRHGQGATQQQSRPVRPPLPQTQQRQQQQPREQPSAAVMKKWIEGDRSSYYVFHNAGLAMDLDEPAFAREQEEAMDMSESESSGSPTSSSPSGTGDTPGEGGPERQPGHDYLATADGGGSSSLEEQAYFQPFTVEEMDVLESQVLDALTLHQNGSPGSEDEAMGLFFGRALGEDAAGEWARQIRGSTEDENTAQALLAALRE